MNLKINSISLGYLRAVKNFLTISSLPVAVSGGVLQYVAYMLAGIEPDIAVCVITFLITFAVYSLNKLSDLKEDAVNVPERLILMQHKEMVLILAGTAYVIGLFQGGRFFGPLGCLYLAPILIGFVYSSKIPGLPRLKEVPGIKGGVVALAWAVTLLIPLIDAGVGLYTGLVIGAWVFIQVFIDVSVYDMRDTLGDRLNGVRTLPVILGERKTAVILMGCNGILLILSPLTKLPKLALAMVAYMCLYIPYFSARRDLLAMDILVENNWLIILGVFYLLKT